MRTPSVGWTAISEHHRVEQIKNKKIKTWEYRKALK